RTDRVTGARQLVTQISGTSCCCGSISLTFPIVLAYPNVRSPSARTALSWCYRHLCRRRSLRHRQGRWKQHRNRQSEIAPTDHRALAFGVCTRRKDNDWAGARVHLVVVSQALETNQRKMAERRHRPMLDQPPPAMTPSPLGKAAKTKFRPPAESSRDRRKTDLEDPTRARLRADVVDEHNLAARPGHAREFIERGFRFWHGSDDKLRDHNVKGAIGQSHPLGIHDRQRLDVTEPVFGDALMCLP